MFGLGMQELIVILIIVVVLFGSTRLPQVGEGVGKMITNFRKSMKQAEKGEEEEEPPSKKEIPRS
jgi:sec-independent protein translocase protein TatA